MQLFLPNFNRCPLDFLQGVISERKKCFYRAQVPSMFVPLWQECGIKAVWPQAIQIEKFRDYIPDNWTMTERTERRYFYGVLCTLAPHFVESVVNEARQLRYAHRLSMPAQRIP